MCGLLLNSAGTFSRNVRIVLHSNGIVRRSESLGVILLPLFKDISGVEIEIRGKSKTYSARSRLPGRSADRGFDPEEKIPHGCIQSSSDSS